MAAGTSAFTRSKRTVAGNTGGFGTPMAWTARTATGRPTAVEYKYFCDAGWGDGDNAIAHLEEELAD